MTHTGDCRHTKPIIQPDHKRPEEPRPASRDENSPSSTVNTCPANYSSVFIRYLLVQEETDSDYYSRSILFYLFLNFL